MKKVVVTGASGLIGKEAISPLVNNGLSVIPCSSKDFNLLDLDSIDKFFKLQKPDYLIHFAWITGNDYLTNPINEQLCKNSFEMLQIFYKYGGQKAVFSGTCFEYDFIDTKLKEDSKLNPKTLYAQKKVELNDLCSNFCYKHNYDYSWGRIFYVYGHKEKSGRLTDYIVKSLMNNEIVTIKYGQLLRDYMYSKEIANAFVKLLLSNVNGNVNICTSEGITLGEYAKVFAAKMNKSDLVSIQSENTTQPLAIIGDNNKLLNEVNYIPETCFSAAIEKILLDYMENIDG